MTTPAAALVGAVARERAGVAALAEVVSLAVHIEPALLRAARLALLPDVDVSAEADLWWSPLVESRGPLGFVLGAEVAEVLRGRLAARPQVLADAWALTERMHRGSPPAVQLEERVAWLSARPGGEEEVDRELLSAVKAMVGAPDQGANVARWAARAVPRLPEDVRSSQAAWLLAMGAGARIGGRRVLAGDPPPGTAARLAAVLPEDITEAAVGLRLFEGAVELTYPPRPRAHRISVPASDALVLRVSGADDNGMPRTVALRYGDVRVVDAAGDVAVEDGLGASHRLVVPQIDIRLDLVRPPDGGFELSITSPYLESGPVVGLPLDLEEVVAMSRSASSLNEQFKVGEALGRAMEDGVFWDVLQRAAFTGGTGRPPSLLVVADYPPLPWELVPLREPLFPDGPPFLGAQAAVAHWLAGQPLPLPLDLAIDDMRYAGGPVTEAIVSGWDAFPVNPEPSKAMRQTDLLHLGAGAGGATASVRPQFTYLDEPFQVFSAQSRLTSGAVGAIVARWVAAADRMAGVGEEFYEKALPGGVAAAEVLRQVRSSPVGEMAGFTLQFFGHPGLTMTRVWPAELWDIATGWRLVGFEGHTGRVTAAAWTPDGTRVVTGSADRTLKVWDVSTGYELLTIYGHDGAVSAVAVSPDCARIVSVSGGAVLTHDLATGRMLNTFYQRAPILALSPIADVGMTTDENGEGALVTLAVSEGPGKLALLGQPVAFGGFSPDGASVAYASHDGRVAMRKTGGGEAVEFGGLHAEVAVVPLPGDRSGRLVGVTDFESGSRDTGVWIGGPSGLRETFRSPGAVAAVAVSPYGDRIAAATEDGVVSVWALGNQDPVCTIPAFGTRRRGVTFAPDGKRLLTWSPPPEKPPQPPEPQSQQAS